jgi:hypothetical protein
MAVWPVPSARLFFCVAGHLDGTSRAARRFARAGRTCLRACCQGKSTRGDANGHRGGARHEERAAGDRGPEPRNLQEPDEIGRDPSPFDGIKVVQARDARNVTDLDAMLGLFRRTG